LSSLAKNLIEQLGSLDGRYVVSTTCGAKPISGFSKLKQKLDELTGIEEHWTLHDIRGGIATYLEENGLDRAYTARILNHKDNSVTGIYARPEHRQHIAWVLEQWSQLLASDDGLSADNILMFAR
jgi:integrase